MNYLDIDDKEVESIYKAIRENVKKYRKEKSITQEQLALAIGHSSASMISKIEAGLENKRYSIKQLYLISKVLDIPFDKLFKLEN